MKHARIIAILAAALASAFAACDMPRFECSGEDPTQPGQPLCRCVNTGELCGHDGFSGCLQCP